MCHETAVSGNRPHSTLHTINVTRLGLGNRDTHVGRAKVWRAGVIAKVHTGTRAVKVLTGGENVLKPATVMAAPVCEYAQSHGFYFCCCLIKALS